MRIPRLRLLLTFVLIAHAAAPELARADETVRQVQEELRRRQLYFGEVDGRQSREVEGAIRRYQLRKSFEPTGAADDETLKSLGLAAHGATTAPSVGAPLPDVPVLKSDVAREVTEADREFLQKIAGDPDLPPVGDGAVEVTQGTETAPTAAPPSPEAALLTEATQFVRDYLAAGDANDLAAELAFYADRTAYFDHGEVGRDFIEKDLRRYYKRWPERKYTLLNLEAVPGAREGEVIAKFRLRFRVRNGALSASGQTANTFTIRRGSDGMKFIGMRERRLQP